MQTCEAVGCTAEATRVISGHAFCGNPAHRDGSHTGGAACDVRPRRVRQPGGKASAGLCRYHADHIAGPRRERGTMRIPTIAGRGRLASPQPDIEGLLLIRGRRIGLMTETPSCRARRGASWLNFGRRWPGSSVTRRGSPRDAACPRRQDCAAVARRDRLAEVRRTRAPRAGRRPSRGAANAAAAACRAASRRRERTAAEADGRCAHARRRSAAVRDARARPSAQLGGSRRRAIRERAASAPHAAVSAACSQQIKRAVRLTLHALQSRRWRGIS